VQKKQAKHPPYEPTPVDNLILQYVRQYHFLTARLLVKIHFSKGSLERAQRKLKLLAENGYLARRRLPHLGVGNPEYIYYLDLKGQHYLKEQGYTGFTRLRKSEIEEMTYPHLQHALELNDFLITARLLSRSVPEISVAAMQHDLDLKKTPAKFRYLRRLPDGGKIEETATIVPDAWLDVRLKLPGAEKQKRRCIVLELDRGTTTNASTFKQKLRAYVHYAVEDGPYYQQFGTNTIIVAYATTAGQDRLKMMRSWCEDELQQQRLSHEAELFRFACLPDGELDPKQVFCEPMWYIPYEEEPSMLLWKV
jgi:hypothetical protein